MHLIKDIRFSGCSSTWKRHLIWLIMPFLLDKIRNMSIRALLTRESLRTYKEGLFLNIPYLDSNGCVHGGLRLRPLKCIKGSHRALSLARHWSSCSLLSYLKLLLMRELGFFCLYRIVGKIEIKSNEKGNILLHWFDQNNLANNDKTHILWFQIRNSIITAPLSCLVGESQVGSFEVTKYNCHIYSACKSWTQTCFFSVIFQRH